MSEHTDAKKPKTEAQSERPDEGTMKLADDGLVLFLELVNGRYVEHWIPRASST